MWDRNYAYSELPSEEETAEEIEFICAVLGLEPGDIVLDLCCGQGRHSVELAIKGYSVVGVDSSRSLLDLVEKERLLDEDAKLWLVEGDMRNIPLKENSCHAVINLFTSFGFFHDEGNQQVLSSVASVLRPGGRFLLEYWNPYVAAQLDGTRNWWWITDNLLALAEARYDFSTSRLQDFRTIVDVEKSSVDNSVREITFYMLPELEKMLKSAGLRVVEIYGDVDERDYDGDSRRLITLSEKVK
jgi:SAM-dependent methyltransferase